MHTQLSSTHTFSKEYEYRFNKKKVCVNLHIEHASKKITLSSPNSDRFCFKNGSLDGEEYLKWKAVAELILEAQEFAYDLFYGTKKA